MAEALQAYLVVEIKEKDKDQPPPDCLGGGLILFILGAVDDLKTSTAPNLEVFCALTLLALYKN
ncbi:hypothetical protein Xkoz_01631 [Xenorhabdus kozodoii]|uniref:Uncharacterized protein n=1 Tax=Xenorhabdus kozodoii TaxID=351676 RepID=A0A2D0LDV3_9GAMM|nr:hypothetical protein Xkoz_01631 [Xenorhabdus kozodoii]